MKMKRTYDDDTGEITYSIGGFDFVASIIASTTNLVESVIQIQDRGGVVLVYGAKLANAENTARRRLFEFYKDNAAA